MRILIFDAKIAKIFTKFLENYLFFFGGYSEVEALSVLCFNT